MAESAPASSPAPGASSGGGTSTTSTAPSSTPAGTAPGQAPGTAPSDAGAGTATPPAPKRYALKFGERTEEVDETKLLHLAQKGYGSEQVFREAAEVRKQQQEFLAALKDPAKAREYLAKHGADPEGLMKAWSIDWYRQQTMTDEQRESAQARQEAEAARAEAEALKAEKAEATHHAETQRAFDSMVETFGQALGKIGNTDPEKVSPRLLQAMANWQQANLATGVQAPPELVAQVAVEAALDDGVAALQLLKSEPAKVYDRLGPELCALIVNETVRRFDAANGAPGAAPQTRPVVVNGGGGERPRNGDGTFKPNGAADRQAASFQRFISGGGQ